MTSPKQFLAKCCTGANGGQWAVMLGWSCVEGVKAETFKIGFIFGGRLMWLILIARLHLQMKMWLFQNIEQKDVDVHRQTQMKLKYCWRTSGNRYICFGIWCHNKASDKSFKPWKAEQYSEFHFYLHLTASCFVLSIALNKAGQICVSTASFIPFWFTEWDLLFPSVISLFPLLRMQEDLGSASGQHQLHPTQSSSLVLALPTRPARCALWFSSYQGVHRLF